MRQTSCGPARERLGPRLPHRACPAGEDEAEIPTFVMMRRLLLVAWIASHAGTDLAQAVGVEYTAQSCALAEDFLGRAR